MSKERVNALIESYEYTFKGTEKAADGFPEAQQLYQIKDGKAHALWYMGHLALALDLFVNQWFLGGDSVIPKDYVAKFAPSVMGAGPITGNAADYPSWDEVVANYRKAGAKTIELLGALNDEDLPGELRGEVPEQARRFFGNLGQSLVGMAAHDSHHRGQIALLKGLAA